MMIVTFLLIELKRVHVIKQLLMVQYDEKCHLMSLLERLHNIFNRFRDFI